MESTVIPCFMPQCTCVASARPRAISAVVLPGPEVILYASRIPTSPSQTSNSCGAYRQSCFSGVSPPAPAYLRASRPG
eukprot:1586987-Pyramimonas_sp.AAC.1